MKTLALIPRLSEKTYRLSQENQTYVFDVPASSNKQSIAQAVERQFKVGVENVNVHIKKGKAKRSLRKRLQPIAGSEVNTKRAYVTLKPGDKIPMFEEG